MSAITINTLYALIVIAGGIVGYLKAGSSASLAMGAAFGLLLIATSFLMYRKVAWALNLSLAATLFLLLFFSYRFTASYKFMPAGLMALLSALTLFYTLYHHRQELMQAE